MTLQSGRFHTRACLALPVKLLDPKEPKLADDAITENVSSMGARVLVKAPRQSDAVLLLHSLTHGFRIPARVVYCEPLSDGEFAVGLHLEGPPVSWADTATGRAA